jgi:hypothetical protein
MASYVSGFAAVCRTGDLPKKDHERSHAVIIIAREHLQRLL